MPFFSHLFVTSRPFVLSIVLGGLATLGVSSGVAAEPGTVSPEALKIHNQGMLFDGHNDLPWQIRKLASG